MSSRLVKKWAALAAVCYVLVGSALESCVHDGVLAATVSASFKLFLMCGFTGWLLQSGRIPQESATVLSKVSAGPQLQGICCLRCDL